MKRGDCDFASAENVAAAARATAAAGYFLIRGSYSLEACARMRAWLDSADDKAAEINYGGTEKRIWGAEKSNDEIRGFAECSDEFLSRMLARPQRCYTTLAIRNRP